MGWFWLFLAILLEVSGTTCMKLSQGFTKIIPSVLIFVFYILSFSAMTLSLKSVDVSVGYAVWAGIGTVLITLIGAVWFGGVFGVFENCIHNTDYCGCCRITLKCVKLLRSMAQ